MVWMFQTKPVLVTDMGNLQTVLPPAKEAKKVINKIKEKEVSFNQEVCQEAS